MRDSIPGHIADDPESCLVMCQLLSEETALSAVLAPYAPLVSSHGTYVALAGDLHWTTSYLLRAAEPTTDVVRYRDGNRKHMFSHKWYAEVVAKERSQEKYRPLVVAGRRRITIPAAHAALPFTGGKRDCYVEWLPLSGEEFRRGDLVTDTETTRVYTIKHAAGALFSRTAVFDAAGHRAGFETTVVTIEASWYFGPPDNIRVDLYGHTYRHDDEHDQVVTPTFFYGVHMSWVDTMLRAQAGFEQQCSPWPDSAEAERLAFMQAHDVSAVAASAFAERIRGLSWCAAFDLVEDASQLAVACASLEPPEFAHRRTPNKRGRDMVARYAQLRPDRAAFIQELWPVARSVLVQ